ncbi:tetratricopeptide repeat protein [Candidatus Auribacterota bacterium]
MSLFITRVKQMDILEKLSTDAENLAQENRWDIQAIKINTQILTVDKNNEGAYARLGRCYMEKKQWLLAREMFLQASNLNPNDRLAKNSLHTIMEKIGDDDTKLADKIGELNDYYQALSLFFVYQKKGEKDLAKLAMEQALKIGKPRRI